VGQQLNDEQRIAGGARQDILDENAEAKAELARLSGSAAHTTSSAPRGPSMKLLLPGFS
jgi:hypothetical protein